jgi:RNA polymerase sigma-70 factor (ECF subfamily)
MSGDRVRARELAHDAFVRAWENLQSYRGESSFDTWMHRLTVNHVLMALRSDRRREARVALSADDAEPGESDIAWVPPANIDDRLDLEDAISRLPTTARQVFVLHDVEGYKHEEIAARLDVAAGTVRAHLHRARQLLMRYLSR